MFRKQRSRVVLSHPRLTVIEDDILLPDGSETSYLRFAATGFGVTMLCRRADGAFLLQREYSYPPDERLLQLPGGGGGDGETPEEAGNRELMEESGYRAGRVTSLGWCYANNRRSDSKMHFFLAEDLSEAALPPDPWELVENVWVAEHELERLIRDGEVVNAFLLAAWALYRARFPPSV